MEGAQFGVCVYVDVNRGVNNSLVSLPRWLSGLSHSAHRPEWPAGGAGVQSPVGQ